MSFRAPAFIAGLILLLFIFDKAPAEEPPKELPANSNPLATSGSSGLAAMAQAAADLRKASEVIERLGVSADVIVSIANSFATMSSDFDPFGYKTAFRTIGQQAQTIQQQQETIHDLQTREIERLRDENKRLKKIAELRKRNDARKRRPRSK